jgi:hypothetical protein
VLFDVPSAYAGPGIQAEGDGPANTAVLLMQGDASLYRGRYLSRCIQHRSLLPRENGHWAGRTVEEVREFVLIPEIPVAYLAN